MKKTRRAQPAKKPTDSGSPPTPPRRRWWKVVAFALLPAPALVIVLELVLRIVNFGGSVALVVPLNCDDGTRLYMLNPQSKQRFFFRQPRNIRIAGSATYRETFARRKPDGTRRIFVVGASAALGYPYPRNVSFATYLESIFKRRDAASRGARPATRFEVINCGITAVSSYAVLDNVRELVRYAPDLIVVYCGHNEFYGTYAPTSAIGSWRWRPAVLAFMRFQRTKIYRLVKRIVERPPAAAPGGSDAASRAHLIGAMPRNEQIRLDSPLHLTVERNYRRNLEAMIAAARRRNVPILLCTLAANERDCGPLRSLHRPDMTSDQQRQWQERFDRARQALADGATSRAVEDLSECVRLDAECADAHFLLGRALEKTGDFQRALRAYRAALDHDGMRFRAGSRLNAVVRDVVDQARGRGVRIGLADVEGAVRAQSPNGLTGLDLIIDHVHLRARGIYLAAVEMVNAAETNDLLAADTPKPPPMPTFEECNEDTGYSVLDELVAIDLMRQLFGDYPFDRIINQREVLDRFEVSSKTLEAGLDPMARTVYRAWLHDRSSLVHNLAANAYFQAGRFADSAREVRTQLRQDDGYDGMTVGFYFHLYMCYSRRKDLDEKQRQREMDTVFEQARDLFGKFHSRPRGQDVLQHLFMGKFYCARSRFADAVPLLEKAVELDPKNRDACQYLLHAYVQTRERGKSLATARRLLELDPGNHYAAAVLKSASQKPPPPRPD